MASSSNSHEQQPTGDLPPSAGEATPSTTSSQLSEPFHLRTRSGEEYLCCVGQMSSSTSLPSGKLTRKLFQEKPKEPVPTPLDSDRTLQDPGAPSSSQMATAGPSTQTFKVTASKPQPSPALESTINWLPNPDHPPMEEERDWRPVSELSIVQPKPIAQPLQDDEEEEIEEEIEEIPISFYFLTPDSFKDSPFKKNSSHYEQLKPDPKDTARFPSLVHRRGLNPSSTMTRHLHTDGEPYYHVSFSDFVNTFHIYLFSSPSQFSILGTESKGDLSVGCYYDPTLRQFHVEQKIINALAPTPPTFLDHAKLAWYETFFFKKSNEDNEERRDLTTSQQLLHFVGWNEHADLHKGSGWLFLLAYVGLGGFIVTPLINIFTLLTEGLLKFLSEVLYDFSARWLSSSNPFSVMCGLFLGLLFLVSTGAYFLVRTITSPFNSVRDCFKVHAAPALQYLLATTSIICTLGFYLGIATISAPLLVLIGAKLGIASLGVALQSGALSHVGIVALVLLKNIGFTITPALTGAASVAFFASITVFLNSMRDVIAESLLKPEEPVVEAAPPGLTPPPSSSGPYLGSST